ncbi:MAG: exonuclease SbcCD subunit D [Thiolinea sp.]
MKFIHTSDWHIGRQFHHVSLLEDQRHVLQQIVALAVTHQVDAVLIAGDIYDRAIPPVEAVNLVDEVLYSLCVEHDIPVILSAGNHDSQERLGFASRQLAQSRLHIIGFQPQEPQPVILSDAHGEVAIYGIPYHDPATIRDLYQAEVSSHDQAAALLCEQIISHRQANNYQRSIVLSHCFIGGSTLCDSERPLSVGGSEQVAAEHFADFNYAALGHLHGAQQRSKDTIRYSGSPLKYSFSETGHIKSVTLVDMDEAGSCHSQALPLQALHDVRIIEGRLDELIEQAAQTPLQQREDFLLARLTDTTALLDPLQKLRAVYPNILALERSGLLQQTTAAHPVRTRRRNHDELAMFADFYQQIQQEPLSDEQHTIIKDLLTELQRNED